jgi:hypothetical protein
MPKLMDRAGGIWTAGLDILGKEKKAPRVKAEQMDRKQPLIILDEDLEPPTQKNGGTKEITIIKNQINPVLTIQRTGGIFNNFNYKQPQERTNPTDSKPELMDPAVGGEEDTRDIREWTPPRRNIVAMACPRRSDLGKNNETIRRSDDLEEMYPGEHSRKIEMLHRRLEDILKEEDAIRSELQRLKKHKRTERTAGW